MRKEVKLSTEKKKKKRNYIQVDILNGETFSNPLKKIFIRLGERASLELIQD